MDKRTSFNIWYVMAAMLAILMFQAVLEQARRVEPISYSTFRTYLAEKRIDQLVVTESRITGHIRDAKPGEPTAFVTARVEPDFARQLEQAGVEFTGGSDQSFIGNLLSWILPMVLFLLGDSTAAMRRFRELQDRDAAFAAQAATKRRLREFIPPDSVAVRR